MKNGLLIWNVVLTLAVGYLLFTLLGKKKTTTSGGETTATKADAATPAFRIAYFEMDSVETNFDMVKDVKTEISKKDEEYNNNLGQLDYTYQKRVQEYQQKGNTMTQADYEKAQIDLKQLEGTLKGRKQELDNQYQDFVLRRNLSVKKKIEDFLVEYNKDKKYSYIVAYEQGLFYYKDTVYNITADLIRGLNQQYTKKKD